MATIRELEAWCYVGVNGYDGDAVQGHVVAEHVLHVCVREHPYSVGASQDPQDIEEKVRLEE